MLDQVYAHLSKDDRLHTIISQCEISPIIPHDRICTSLIHSIISQQLSGKVADVITQRFMALFEGPDPHPSDILNLEESTLRDVGLSRSKVQYVRNVASFFLEKGERIDWGNLSDEIIQRELTQIKGIGEWTVQMLLIFTLGRPDVFPKKDLVIRQCIVNLYELKEEGKELFRKMDAIAAQWRPYRSFAARLIWQWREISS